MSETSASLSTGARAHPRHHPSYVRIWAILAILLVVSVTGPFLGIRTVTLITAFGIAIVKAYLVAKYFMHIGLERRFVVYLLVAMLAIMVLMVGGFSPDVMKHDGLRWENVGAKTEVGRGEARANEGAHH